MATTTTNIGLTKPDGTENVSRQVINNNYDLIDAAVGNRKLIKSTEFTVSAPSSTAINGVAIGERISYGRILATDVVIALNLNQVIGVYWADSLYGSNQIPYEINVRIVNSSGTIYIEYDYIKVKAIENNSNPVPTNNKFRFIYADNRTTP